VIVSSTAAWWQASSEGRQALLMMTAEEESDWSDRYRRRVDKVVGPVPETLEKMLIWIMA